MPETSSLLQYPPHHILSTDLRFRVFFHPGKLLKRKVSLGLYYEMCGPIQFLKPFVLLGVQVPEEYLDNGDRRTFGNVAS